MQRQMYGKKFISILLCAVMMVGSPAFMTSAFADDSVGTPYGGEALTISSAGTTVLYAAQVNDGAGTGFTTNNSLGSGYTLAEKPEDWDIRCNTEGGWWTYTVNVAVAGTYKLEVLGTSGYNMWSEDVSGRFSMTIGDRTIVDGKGNNPVIMPANGEQTSAPNRVWYKFDDTDKTEIGTVPLSAGENVIKVTVDVPGETYGIMLKRFYFTPVSIDVPVGTAWNGTPQTIAAEGTSVLYAARRNENAGSGGTVYGRTGQGYDLTNAPENSDIRSTTAGDWWAYTVDVEEAGMYQISAMGTNGYANGDTNVDANGRFSLTIDGEKFLDGTDADAPAMPSSGDGTRSGVNKAWFEFTKTDAVNLGAVFLDKGNHDIVLSIDVPGDAYGIIFGEFYFTKVSAVAEITGADGLTLGVGGNKTATYTLTPALAELKGISWESGDTTVCQVENGVITANAVGDTTVTLGINDGYQVLTRSYKITVNEYDVVSHSTEDMQTTFTVQGQGTGNVKIILAEYGDNDILIKVTPQDVTENGEFTKQFSLSSDSRIKTRRVYIWNLETVKPMSAEYDVK